MQPTSAHTAADSLGASTLRRVAVLYNPRSGGRRSRRMAEIEAVTAVLRSAGIESIVAETRSSAEAGSQAREAVASGVDAIFVCGGDGTVHDVLQGMVGSAVPLGIIPQGTANALAHDRGVPSNAAKAARAALTAEPLRVALGKLECNGLDGNPVTRYFTVTVGIGADASLFYQLTNQQLGHNFKARFGMAAYVIKALQIWLTQRMPYFEAELDAGEKARVTELLAVRIRDFGNVLRELAPGASLSRNDLRLVLFRTHRRLNYLGFVLRGLFGLRVQVPGIEFRDSTRVVCCELEGSASSSRTYIEADGELVGCLPATITIVPDALTLLAPRRP